MPKAWQLAYGQPSRRTGELSWVSSQHEIPRLRRERAGDTDDQIRRAVAVRVAIDIGIGAIGDGAQLADDIVEGGGAAPTLLPRAS